MPACKNCGDQFKPSRSGAAVNCPSCRTPEGRRAKKQQSTPSTSSDACPMCKGTRRETNRLSDYSGPCRDCGGTGSRRGFNAVMGR